MAPLPKQLADWLASRPASVRKLAAEFPLDSKFIVGGQVHWLFGYNEGDALIITPVDPDLDYELAMELRKHLHAQHVRDGEIKRVS